MATLRDHLRNVDPHRLFAVVALPHAPTTQIFVRQLQALVTPGTQVSDDLIEAGIWWFNTHRPAQGGVWVPHLGVVHTLIAPPTDPRPAPTTGGWERAAPPPRPYNLRIPPQEGLEAWESGTARSRGHNLTNLTAHYPETTRAAPSPRERDPGTIAMIVLENGHYYQVRIIPHPQDNQWSLEAVDSMLRETPGLPDNPTPLLPNQPPDPLTAIVSGAAGTWHPGHALYCLWRWARRRWPHTRAWSAAWRFYLDGRQQMEAIPELTAETPTEPNLCLVFAIHQIRSLALNGQLQPAIRTETEARPAHAALVHKIFSALRSALVRRAGNLPGPRSATNQRTCSDDARPHAHGTSPTPATRREETARRTRDRLLPPEDRTMTVTPAAARSATNHNDPDRADLAQHAPSYNPATRGRATCYGTTRRPDTPAGTASTCPARTADTRGVEASLSSPRCRTQIRPQRPLPTSPGRGPHFPDFSDPPATRKWGSARPGTAIPPDPPLPRNGSERGRAKGPAKHAEPAAKPMTTGVLSNSARHRIRTLALGD